MAQPLTGTSRADAPRHPDPRHSFAHNPLTSFAASHLSQWPEPIGMAAIGDAALVEQFGDIARQEYLALGIRVALHPMADLATEPRWARINGTFGEDAHVAAALTAAYIRGFQGRELGTQSVACMTKHFPGGGPQLDGEDPHFAYGREQIYPGDNFDYHLIPFEAAFAAGTAQIMPYYGMPIGTPLEPVGFAFSKQVITEMLRIRYGFDGVVCSDWGLINDVRIGDMVMVARAWGIEHLTPEQRLQKALEAGIDQFGGEACPELVVALVERGAITEARIDESVRRLLREKFRLGLFDAPYLDAAVAEAIVGSPGFREAGALAQRRAMVLLKNGTMHGETVLPLAGGLRLYVEGIAADVAAQHGELVAAPADADLAIIRLATPYQPRNGDFLEQLFHAGDLDFKEPELGRIRAILAAVPTVVAIHLDRPAVIPEIAAECAALIGEFGASDEALFDVLIGRFEPSARLPFELPASMESVRAQHPDLPHDTDDPLFPFGFGLSYFGEET
ncbi:MAG TPA: glycoside hydrolase family 3 N-terminal domain-containing protein [Roseiflexaceae bacterium]|nr:glycoside hydrolase family 3 N-terminal domain-containing protein [Roseiflexaceae bacterium]